MNKKTHLILVDVQNILMILEITGCDKSPETHLENTPEDGQNQFFPEHISILG